MFRNSPGNLRNGDGGMLLDFSSVIIGVRNSLLTYELWLSIVNCALIRPESGWGEVPVVVLGTRVADASWTKHELA